MQRVTRNIVERISVQVRSPGGRAGRFLELELREFSPGRGGSLPQSFSARTFRPMESRTGRPLVQVPHLQWFEAFEVAVVRKNGADAVLSAERANLRVEHQVAARICLASDRA